MSFHIRTSVTAIIGILSLTVAGIFLLTILDKYLYELDILNLQFNPIFAGASRSILSLPPILNWIIVGFSVLFIIWSILTIIERHRYTYRDQEEF